MAQAIPMWFEEYLTPHLLQSMAVRREVFSGETAYQQVQVLETAAFGRCLVLDGKIQSAESDEFIYHEALVHPALVTHPNPETVFIAGGGEGATLREALRHSTVHSTVLRTLQCTTFYSTAHSIITDSVVHSTLHYTVHSVLQDILLIAMSSTVLDCSFYSTLHSTQDVYYRGE